MYGKKQRIISFLMAFLLIFTFAFINPLTTSKSYAVLPALTLTANGVKIIMATLASAGIGITAGQALQEVDFENAAEGIANIVYRTLDGAEKLALFALSVVDNVVEVPISLYNAIVNNAKKVFETSEYSQTLIEQGISIKYAHISSVNEEDPSLNIPIYKFPEGVITDGTTKNIDMSDAEPFLVYDGTKAPDNTFGHLECITTNYFDFATEENPIISVDIPDTEFRGYVFFTPSLLGYQMRSNKDYVNDNYPYMSAMYLLNYGRYIDDTTIYLRTTAMRNGTIGVSKNEIGLNRNAYFKNVPFNQLKLFFYFVQISSGIVGVFCDVYNGDDFVYQRWYGNTTNTGFSSILKPDYIYDTPLNLDTTINVEETPSSVITNTDATSNVLTLPTTVVDTIGLTSTDVNVGGTDVPDVPDTPNTETMDNINTNVGELVTGGTLGEQVNTNIGTVEGLHGELTEQVDFGAIFDTISQYISSLDISSVTWFPTAVASFLVPFLPVISLGLILFFIDRVLNGGA